MPVKWRLSPAPARLGRGHGHRSRRSGRRPRRGRQQRPGLQETVEKIKALGRRCLGIKADLIDAKSSADYRRHAERIRPDRHSYQLRRHHPPGAGHQFSEKDWDDVIPNQSSDVLYVSGGRPGNGQAKERQDHQHPSLLSFQGGIIVPSYTASKSAVAGLTKALANEWAPLGINVNAIAPGYMATK